MTGGDLVVRCLAVQRVRHVFGIPGALNAGLYDALARQAEIEHILVRHELGAAWMADGYARATGEVGVCVTVPGPGATHAASGIAGAFTDCVPVLRRVHADLPGTDERAFNLTRASSRGRGRTLVGSHRCLTSADTSRPTANR